MAIELTPEQRQVVLAHPDTPVEVIDPATQHLYVLLTREQYERVQPLLSSVPAPSPVEGQRSSSPLPQRLAELPTPPEVVDEAQRRYARRKAWGGKTLSAIAEELKLQYYYGGLCVSYLRTPQGIVVMAAGRSGTTAYQEQLNAVPAGQRGQLILSLPPPWNDEAAEVLTPYDDES